MPINDNKPEDQVSPAVESEETRLLRVALRDGNKEMVQGLIDTSSVDHATGTFSEADEALQEKLNAEYRKLVDEGKIKPGPRSSIEKILEEGATVDRKKDGSELDNLDNKYRDLAEKRNKTNKGRDGR